MFTPILPSVTFAKASGSGRTQIRSSVWRKVSPATPECEVGGRREWRMTVPSRANDCQNATEALFCTSLDLLWTCTLKSNPDIGRALDHQVPRIAPIHYFHPLISNTFRPRSVEYLQYPHLGSPLRLTFAPRQRSHRIVRKRDWKLHYIRVILGSIIEA